MNIADPIVLPPALDAWLIREREYCFDTVGYGKAIRTYWKDASGIIANAIRPRIDTLSAEGQAMITPFVESLNGAGGIPGYEGIIKRSLRLVQMADHAQTGSHVDKIAVTTLATNQRYAAVYEPRVARDWRVIALDWGFASALWSLSVCFSSIATATQTPEGLVFSLDAKRITESVTRAKSLPLTFSRVIVPAILMGDEPPVGLDHDPTTRFPVIAGLVFNGLMFSVIAHEYSHVQRKHLSLTNPSPEERHQMEFEADALALAYALTNPWSSVLGSQHHSSALMAATCQWLALSFIGMLETGDRMLADLGRSPMLERSHPPSNERLAATQHALNNVLAIDRSVKALVNKQRAGMAAFSDAIWNTSVPLVLDRLRQSQVRATPPAVVAPRDAQLLFL